MNTQGLNILTLRCFAYQHKSGVYVAECLDLNLIASGKTSKAAVKGLYDAIQGYLEVASEGDQTGLIPRKSSWTSFLRYYRIKLRTGWREAMHPASNEQTLKTFSRSCHA